MRVLRLVLALGLAIVPAVVPLTAEVWNEPAGVTVTTTSQTVTFPRPMSAVLIHNDDTTNAIFVRIFWCSEETAAATANSLEIKKTKSRSFTRGATDPDYYCAISLICSAGTPSTRIEAK